MTSMQVEYNKLVETRRHNEATERLSARDLDLKGASYSEQARHNLVTEALSAGDLQEKIRHQKFQDTETLRHNGATEAEINRHNKATEAQAIADNEVKIAIAKMNNLSQQQINESKLANERYLKQQQLDYQKQADQLDRALKTYEIDTNKALKETDQALTRGKMINDLKKINADCAKINADIENNVRKTALEYAKNPAAAALAESMLAAEKLAPDASVPGVAADIVQSILSENNMKDVTDKDVSWWRRAIDVAISQGKSTTVFGFTERAKQLEVLEDELAKAHELTVPSANPKRFTGKDDPAYLG